MRRLLSIGLLAILCTGCAARVTVLAAGVVDPQDLGKVFRQTTAAVVVDAESQSTELHREFASKIETALRESGFEIVLVGEAETLAVFKFGTRGHDPVAVRSGGEMRYGPLAHRVRGFDHYFRIVLLDATPYREDGTERVIWAGEAVLANRMSKNPGRSDQQAIEILDLLREGALEFLGRNQKSTAIGYLGVKSLHRTPGCRSGTLDRRERKT